MADVGSAVGFMLLNGKRLGNLSAIEAIPNAAILGFHQSQTAALGAAIAGEILWNAGSRDGVDGNVHKVCTDQEPDRLLYRPIRMAWRSRLSSRTRSPMLRSSK